MIITSILYLSIIGMIIGGLFQLILGIIQLLSFCIYIANWSKIATRLKQHFIIYGVLTSLLIPFYCFATTEVFINTLIGYSAILAFYFLYIAYSQYKYVTYEL
ncbi:hypothetical protein [uncultured Dokdonia sp.]|uniref:hypothetical protein n=1 Tax=uncultured Dokdonia sp. TaxID=575653 RepID=UPI00262232A3|nr:hypothetical protein [uncultured Dokdonia sp.]